MAGISSIQTNTSAMYSLRNLWASQSMAAKSMQKLASGFQINSAADDAAGLSISEKMRALIGGMDAASSNVMDAVSMLDTAESGMGVIQSMLQSMRTLSVRAMNGTMSDTDREMLNGEFQQLMSGINQIASSNSFNGMKLLDGSMVNFQIGPDDAGYDQLAVNMGDMSISGMGLGSLDISTADGAKAAMGTLSGTINLVSQQRGNLGAQVNRLDYTYSNLQNSIENLMGAESRIRDTDMPKEMMRYSQANLLMQANQTMLGLSLQQKYGIMNLFV
ncbi:MAG: flagellin [Clostridiales bacterium]|nr:flagellin [Clostridiales bacterium]